MKKIKLLLALSMTALFGLAEYGHAATMESSDLYISTHSQYGSVAVMNRQPFTPGKDGAILYKIVISSAGTGSATVEAFNNIFSTTTNKITQLIGTTPREVEYNVRLSSGLTYNIAGTLSPGVSFLYRLGIPDREAWGPFISSFTATADGPVSVAGGGKNQVQLYKVICGQPSVSTASNIAIYNNFSNGTTGLVTQIDGTSFSDNKFNVHLSSGLTYQTTGTAGWTLLYRLK